MSPRVILAPEVFGPDTTPPTTPMEALMRAGFEEPVESTVERKHPLDAAIEAAFVDFSDDDRDMIVMHLVGGLSTRQISEFTGVSKSEVHRRLPKLQEKLAEAMKSNPEILKHIGGTE